MTFTFKISKRLALTCATLGALVWGCTDVPSDTSSRRIAVDPPAAVGDTLFTDGFESGAIAWDDNFRPLAKTVVAGAARSGTYGLRVTVSPTVNGGVLSKFVTPGDRVFFRAAVRFPATWTGSTGLLTLRAAPASNPWAGFGTTGVCPSGSTWANTGVTTMTSNLDLRFNTSYVGMPNLSTGGCQASAGLTWPSLATYTPPLAVSKGVWHVVEIEAQLNTVGVADGWQRVWLDGTLRGQWTGLTFRTSTGIQWNAVSLELPSTGVTQTQALDIDDVLVLRQQPAAAVATVQVTPASATLNVGQTLGLTATLRDAAGNTLTNRAVIWSSSNVTVATVNGSGAVTTLTAGSATITATSEGRSGSAAITVAPPTPTGQVLLAEGFDDTQFAGRGWYDFATTPAVTTADKRSGAGALQLQWSAGSTSPPMRVMRKLFTATDRLYVSYWVKYSTNYVGSGKAYHPHEFNVLSSQDQDWDGLTFNYLNTYIEQNYQNGGIPRLAIQDSRMIDASRIGVNLTGVTENRSVAGCNGNSDGTSVTSCYQATPTQWYNAKTWNAAAVAFRPTAGTDYKSNWNRVEVELQLNTVVNGIGQANGIVRYWLNGTLKLERTNVLFRTGANPNLKFRQFLLTPYIGDGSPVAQTMWVDDLVLATSRDGSTPPPAPVATVTVTPATATVAVGATTQLTAVARDAAGAVLTGRTTTWTTSASGVATVVNGLVTGRGAGQATITATSEGRAGFAVITVPAPTTTPVATVTVTPATATVAVGATTQLTAVARDAAGATLTGRTITWTTSTSGITTVVNGLVTGVAAGQAIITATSEGKTGSATITVSAPVTTGSYPNEPAGAVALMDWDTDFSNLASGGWGYISGSTNLSTVSDATAPVNPSKVGRVRFASGCCNGTGPARLETYKVPPSGWTRWYVSDWVKFDPQFVPHACCQKLFEFYWSSGGDKWLIVKADPATSGAFPLIARLTAEYAGVATQNLGGQAVIRAGVWYQYEVIVHRSGRVQLWIREQGKSPVVMYDGTPAGAGTINPGFLFWWWGYGGLGAYSGTVPGYIYHNHFRVSYTP